MSFLSSILPVVGAIAGSFIAPGIGTAIGAGLGSAVGGALSSSDASSAQQQGANNAINTQQQMFDQIQRNLGPYLKSGQLSLEDLNKFLGIGGTPGNATFDPNAPGVRPFGMQDFQQDPGYKYRLNEGLNAILNKRSAMGGMNSGATMKGINDYAQAMAGQEYGNAYNRYNQNNQNTYGRLYNQTGAGQNAAASLGGFGENAAGNIGSLQQAIGAQQAAGILGGQNAGQGLANNYLLASALQNPNSGGGGGIGQYIPGTPQYNTYNNFMTDLNQQAFFDPYYGG